MVSVQIASHLVRRGVAAAQEHFAGANPQYISMLQQEATLYEDAGPDGSVTPAQFIPAIVIGFFTLLILASVRYTIGNVAVSLAMIESPTAIAIIEPKPPAYADEPDAPLEKEKEPLMPAEADADRDVEITIINHKPVTANIKSTIGLLHRVGGFRGRWRGLAMSFFYHGVHNFATQMISGFLGFGMFGHAAVYVFTTVGLSRWHMAWTHAMIATPNSKPLFQRLVPRQQCRALVLPSLVFALAQQATIMMPVALAFSLGLHNINGEAIVRAAQNGDTQPLMCTAMRIMAVPVTGLIVALAVLLPASVTLTRIEACLLPEDQETIVPFDRDAVVGSISLEERGGCKTLFVEAWRSFDRAARWRLLKLYAKMAVIEVTVAVVGLQMMVASVYLLGGEKLALFFRSARAQIELELVDTQQAGPQ